MNDQAPLDPALLQRRLTLVGEISALNARMLKLVQQLSGAEMEVLRLELEIVKAGASAQLVRELHEANKSAEAIRADQAECDGCISETERKVADLDQLIAAARQN